MNKNLEQSIKALFAHNNEEQAREILKLVNPAELRECLAAVKVYEKLVLNV